MTPVTTPVVTTETTTVTTTPGGNIQIIRIESEEGNWLLRGQTFHLRISYDTHPKNSGLSGIGVQIVLPNGIEYVGVDMKFNNNLFGGVTTNGNAVSFQYVDIMSTNWPGVDTPLDLMILELRTTEKFFGGELDINFSSTAAGFDGWTPGLELFFGMFNKF